MKYKIDYVINLAAQAGVRYSIINPKTYLENNIISFFNILDISKEFKIKHLIFASSSSVYGESNQILKEGSAKLKQMSFYASSKISNESMAHAYSNVFKIPITGLRFFTVYGPFGRPDMAIYKFTDSIIKSKKLMFIIMEIITEIFPI